MPKSTATVRDIDFDWDSMSGPLEGGLERCARPRNSDLLTGLQERERGEWKGREGEKEKRQGDKEGENWEQKEEESPKQLPILHTEVITVGH